MPLSQAFQYLLKEDLVTLRDPPQNPNTLFPKYNPNARCANHSNSPGHDTNDCWDLKSKIQYMIDAEEIEFYPLEIPNVIIVPMPSHGKGVNSIDDVSYVSTINDLTTPLMIIKKNLLRASLFSGYPKNGYHCASQTNGCMWLKKGIQRLIDSHEILFEKTPPIKSLPESILEDVSIITISNTPIRITSKGPIRIPAEPRVVLYPNFFP